MFSRQIGHKATSLCALSFEATLFFNNVNGSISRTPEKEECSFDIEELVMTSESFGTPKA